MADALLQRHSGQSHGHRRNDGEKIDKGAVVAVNLVGAGFEAEMILPGTTEGARWD